MYRVLILLIFMLLDASCGRYLEEGLESPVIDNGRVTFRLKDPSARTVQVAGDFNNWGMGDAETGEVLVGLMEKDEKHGLWEITLELEPGRYRYRFLVNEAGWVLDPQNPRIVDDGKGGKANLLMMP